jgi:acetyl-CoA carboxylase biotin carboxyl carrier protein
MDANDKKKLSELIEFLKANHVQEFESERDGEKIRLKFEGAGAAADLAQLSHLLAAAPGAAGRAPSVAMHVPAHTETAATDEDAGLKPVKSPIVGTFYESSAPGAPAFVKVGDHVEVGTVLCIVEAMKLMNEIESDVAGEIVKLVATNGQPVEFGQTLYLVRPK